MPTRIRASQTAEKNSQSDALERALDGPCVAIYGVDEGGTRFFVACSNAYASSISRGSLQDAPVKPTPNGPGFASNPAGNGGLGPFCTTAKRSTTIGAPVHAAM